MAFYKMSDDINKKYTIKLSDKGYGKTYYDLTKILLQLKFNVNSIGFRYWQYAIILYRKDYFLFDNSIEKIYNKVAIFFNTTRTRVERAMRTARKPADEEIQKQFNYYGRISNKSVLELLTHDYRILFDKVEKLETNATFEDIQKHIPTID